MAKVVYLGNWMANANRIGQDDDPRLDEYEEIADLVFSYASKFGFPKDLENELEIADGMETTEVSRLHEEYDEETFWEELSGRLGTREFYRKYSRKELEGMTQSERFIKLQECVIAWEEEVNEHGLERLEIKEK